MKPIKALLFALVFSSLCCTAQDIDQPVIISSRPGCTWGTEVLHHHKVAWENGFQYDQLPDGTKTLSLNGSILRYGLSENTEIYLGSGLHLANNGSGWNLNEIGITPLLFGTKIKCYEGKGLIPSMGVLAEFNVPKIGSKDLCPSYIAPKLYLLLEQHLFEGFNLCYNAGLKWDGERAEPTLYLAIGAWFSITERLGGYAETNNYFHSEDGSQYMTEFGLTWLASRRVQLDLSAALDFQHLMDFYAISCGVSWMLN